jgi:glycerophosphoryl diester phosphodiesterase
LIDAAAPLIYGHRGASAYAPENTLTAFQLALEQGADGFELDAKLSSDGVVVVMHDQTVDRTTNQKGPVAGFSGVELHQMDAGCHFSPQFKGEPIPSLEEIFIKFGKKLIINVELTNYTSPTDALPVKVAELIYNYDLEKTVLISSFHPLNLIRIHRKLPGITLGLLTLPGKKGALGRSRFGSLIPQTAIHPHFQDVSQELIDYTHKKGKKVNAWTVNEPGDIQRMCSMGVDRIITDKPDLARKVAGR